MSAEVIELLMSADVGMPLWFGANEQPMYRPQTAWWMAMNVSALSGDITSSSPRRYADVCAVSISSSMCGFPPRTLRSQ